VKAIVVGGNGQLGMDLVAELAAAGHNAISLTHADIEIGDEQSVANVIAPLEADLVINTAAMHNVEVCEQEPEQAFRVNALGPRNLARACAASAAMLIQVSTDYVFGGEKKTPYLESDAPHPLNTYGITKLAGEHYSFANNAKTAVVRTSAIYGANPCRAKKNDNFVKMMLRLGTERGSVKVVADEFVSPTYTLDLARQIVAIAEAGAFGTFHATSNGQVSWNEFAKAIFNEAGNAARVDSATSADFPSKIRRPAYSVLDNAALRARGLDKMPDWRDALKRYLRAIGITSA
jgi:dTDP-4-dehydrorhamnose reductase